MDYSILAKTLLENMHRIGRHRPDKSIRQAIKGEMFVLRYLSHHKGDVVPGDIGKVMNVSSARIAQTLNSLEKKGWVTREIDAEDRRRILVKLTAEGKKQTEQHQEKVIRNTIKILELLGEHDAKEYVRITGRLAEIMPQCEKLLYKV